MREQELFLLRILCSSCLFAKKINVQKGIHNELTLLVRNALQFHQYAFEIHVECITCQSYSPMSWHCQIVNIAIVYI